MFSKKKILKHNNDILFKRNTELNKINIELQKGLQERDKRISDLLEKNREIESQLITTSEILNDKQKEVKRLKTLLTKNNIEYRKEN